MIKDKVNLLVKKGAVHVVIGSFFTKFISFFGSIFIVRFLNKNEYGVLSYFENILGYFTIIAGLGLAVGVQRYMVLAEGDGKKKDCFLYSLRRGSLLNVLLVLAFVLFCFLYPHPDEFRGFPTIIISLGLCIPFIFIINICQSSLRALFDHKNYAYLAFVTSVILIVFRVAGAGWGGLNLSVIFRLIAEVLCALLCICIFFGCYLKQTTRVSNTKLFLRKLNKYSLQMMLTDGLWAIFMLNDMFLLGQFAGDSSILADYKVAVVIPANLSILTAAVGIFAAPYFTRHENDNAWVRKYLSLLLMVTVVAAGLIAGLCALFSEEIVTFIYGNQYNSSASVMIVLLIASFVNNGIRATIANVLSAMGRQHVNLIVAGIGVLLQLVLDTLLISRYGAFGVAWSSVIVYFIMATILVCYTFKKIFQTEKQSK